MILHLFAPWCPQMLMDSIIYPRSECRLLEVCREVLGSVRNISFRQMSVRCLPERGTRLWWMRYKDEVD